MKILAVSDPHFGLTKFDWVVQQAGNYDLVIIAGDLLDLTARYPPPLTWLDDEMLVALVADEGRALPYRFGVDGSYEALATGEVVAYDLAAGGDRVAVASSTAGPRSKGRYQQYGGCANYAVAPASAVRRVPLHWSFAQAACFGQLASC